MEYDPGLHSLQCPKCEHGMEEVTHDAVTIDRCTNCHGLWFDTGEAEQLKSLPGGESLDTGDRGEGRKYDSRTDINCPHCAKAMEKTSDPDQIHIWYEVCKDHGLFMDAGEFTDFKSETLLDIFRGMVKGHRDTVAP